MLHRLHGSAESVQGCRTGHVQARALTPMTRSAGSISHSGCKELSGSPGSSYIRTYLHISRGIDLHTVAQRYLVP